MDALGGRGGANSWWLWRRPRGRNPRRRPSSLRGGQSAAAGGGRGYSFPIKQAATAASLVLTGDTIAQFRHRIVKGDLPQGNDSKDVTSSLLLNHDWLRALRMASYGFLLYGPGSYAWYQYLEHSLPKQSVENLLLKVLLNQVVLGPVVIAVVFAWNNLWVGKLSQLPKKYQQDALPTLLYGFRFWIPVSVLNFWVVPLQARVAFMSAASIFWNFCLSSTVSK